MKPLSDWSPQFLKTRYKQEVDKLSWKEFTEEQKQVQLENIEAVYRLGTYQTMKEVWSKLLARDTFLKYPVDKEMALVGSICDRMCLYAFGGVQDTPEAKTKELKKIIHKIDDLKEKIQNSSHASFWDTKAMEALLHKKNIEYRNKNGESIGAQSPTYLKHVSGNAGQAMSITSLDEHMPWLKRTSAQHLGWWTREALGLSLSEILNFYSELMEDVSEVYKENYAIRTSNMSRLLSSFMEEMYEQPLDEYVASIMCAIYGNDSWERDKVRKLRGYKKTQDI